MSVSIALATLTALATQGVGQEAPAHYNPEEPKPIVPSQSVAAVDLAPIVPTSAPETFAPEAPVARSKQQHTSPIVPDTTFHQPQHQSIPFSNSVKALSEVNIISSPEALPSSATTLAPATLVQATRIPVSSAAGVSRRRTQTRRFTTVRVTNRTSRSIEVELVGTTRPIVLLPGQTRQLRVKSRDLSLLYWAPSAPGVSATQLQAELTQSGAQTLSVDLFRSEFPNDNLAIYFPEPDNPSQDILKVF